MAKAKSTTAKSPALTQEAVLAMEPGNDLNRLVAERVFGWSREVRRMYAGARNVEGWGLNQHLSLGSRERRFVTSIGLFPRYSTDIGAAWEVVEKFIEAGLNVTCGGPHLAIAAKYWARVGNNMAQPVPGDTAPLAICRATVIYTL